MLVALVSVVISMLLDSNFQDPFGAAVFALIGSLLLLWGYNDLLHESIQVSTLLIKKEQHPLSYYFFTILRFISGATLIVIGFLVWDI